VLPSAHVNRVGVWFVYLYLFTASR
jgi:hypothetical protein